MIMSLRRERPTPLREQPPPKLRFAVCFIPRIMTDPGVLGVLRLSTRLRNRLDHLPRECRRHDKVVPSMKAPDRQIDQPIRVCGIPRHRSVPSPPISSGRPPLVSKTRSHPSRYRSGRSDRDQLGTPPRPLQDRQHPRAIWLVWRPNLDRHPRFDSACGKRTMAGQRDGSSRSAGPKPTSSCLRLSVPRSPDPCKKQN